MASKLSNTNKNQRNTRYPRFALFWVDESGKHGRYYTRRKKSISFKLDGLYKVRKAHFKLVYGSKRGEQLTNESIVYSLPQQFSKLKHDWRLFSADEEIKSCLQ